MQFVGTVALDAPRGVGSPVVVRSSDLSGAVRAGVRVLVRAGSAVLRRGPVWSALVAVARLRSTPQLATAGRTAVGGAALGGPRFVTHGPATIPAPRREPTVPRGREIALPVDPTAPRLARGLLQATVLEWDLDDDLHQDAAMVVTELVANAVDHARTTSTLAITWDDRGLYLAVRDGRPEPLPRPRPVDPTAPRGRGLQMIAALATSWGVTTHTDGKTVWAVLPRG